MLAARAPAKTNTVGGHSICPRPDKNESSQGCGFPLPLCGISTPHPGVAFRSLPCVRGGAARSAAEGLCLTETIFFLFCKLSAFTIPQALARQLPLHKGAFFGLCEHCGYVPCPSQGRPLVACKAPSGRGLPRERVGEHARQRAFCTVWKFIRLSHPKFGDSYPKQNLTSSLRALPLPPPAPPPSQRGACCRPLLKSEPGKQADMSCRFAATASPADSGSYWAGGAGCTP